jgi:pilus assembly protein Flp/PilA
LIFADVFSAELRDRSYGWSKPTEVTMTLIKRFLRNEAGATAIEYGLIAAGIALAIIAVVNGLGTNLNTKFADINTSLR